MDELSKKVRKELENRPPIDWSNTKPPTRPAIEAMLENLHAAAGTEADHSPKKPDNKNPKSRKK